jgi:hypothetical protein
MYPPHFERIEDVKKLYVISRKDLGLIYQGVQAGHALAQWCLENPENLWQNKTLVYLQVKNLKKLLSWREYLRRKKIKVSEFVEPDVGYQVTAIACYTRGKMFEKLDLFGCEQTGMTQKSLGRKEDE